MNINNKDIEREIKLRKCIICGERKEKGINILNNLICNECNDSLIKLKVENEGYDFAKEKIKKCLVEKIK